jgi:hypothetical protein
MAQGDVARGFQELVRIQTEQFQELTERFSRFLSGWRPDQKDLEKP